MVEGGGSGAEEDVGALSASTLAALGMVRWHVLGLWVCFSALG